MASLNDYLLRSAEAINAMAERDLSSAMERAIGMIVAALSSGKTVAGLRQWRLGSDAIHIAGELVGRFLKDRKAYNVIALPANAGMVTAWGNDYGFDTVYSRQVEAHGAAGRRVARHFDERQFEEHTARRRAGTRDGHHGIRLTGDTGGKLAPLSDILLNVPSNSTPIIQQGHLCLYHYLCEVVEARLTSG